jgi:hypothetical protein
VDGVALVFNQTSTTQFIPERFFAPYNTIYFSLSAEKSSVNKTAATIQIIIMLEQDIPVLTTTIPTAILGKRVNMNTDIQVDIDYIKPPDQAYYSLIFFY